jgi:hypothetical protein
MKMEWRVVFVLDQKIEKIMEFPIVKTKKGLGLQTQKRILEIQAFIEKEKGIITEIIHKE